MYIAHCRHSQGYMCNTHTGRRRLLECIWECLGSSGRRGYSRCSMAKDYTRICQALKIQTYHGNILLHAGDTPPPLESPINLPGPRVVAAFSLTAYANQEIGILTFGYTWGWVWMVMAIGIATGNPPDCGPFKQIMPKNIPHPE